MLQQQFFDFLQLKVDIKQFLALLSSPLHRLKQFRVSSFDRLEACSFKILEGLVFAGLRLLKGTAVSCWVLL